MRYAGLSAVLALSFASSMMSGQNLSIGNYQLLGSQRVTLTQFNYTYTATLTNTGGPLTSVTAKVTSADPNIKIVAGKDTLNFAPVPANGQVPTSNTFVVTVDRSVMVDFTKLQWTFMITGTAPPIANAGPDQTATIGQLVTLNGSASTNPSGLGTLTYSWAFTSKPAGSAATLSNPTSVSPTFTPDKAGDYLVALTVSNGVQGVASSTDEVKITTSPNNTKPTANAGVNQTVALNATVTLNGSGSSDVDGDPLTYAWTFTSRPQGSTATLTGANTVAPTFVADVAGQYIVQLIVNDGKDSSNPSSVTITVTPGNTIPVADAKADKTSAKVGDLITLDGSGSTDADGDPLTYKWSLITRPTGSNATLSSTTAVKPTFTVDVAGNFVAQLIVNDGKADSAPKTVTISTTDIQAPTANAGDDQTVAFNAVVTLHGSGTDPQNLPLTFKWSLISKPANSTATLSNPNSATPTFVADKPGDYVAQLIVNNGSKDSAPDTVKITTNNPSEPIANIAPSATTVDVGTTVTLNGSGSTDPQTLPLTYSFSLTSKPQGSNATLTGATTVSASFVADQPGDYVVQLIVNNGFLNSAPKTVTIHANAVVGPAASITATSGGGQSAKVGTAFAAPLVATVKDSNGAAVPNVTVTFTAPASGASGTFAGGAATATATTNASGVATSPVFTANNTSGGPYNVTASVAGVGTPANFSLTNLSADAGTIAATGGTPQSAEVNTAFATTLSATVKDQFNNPVSGATVTFTAPATGASGTFAGGSATATATTNASGVATSPVFTANTTAGGPYNVTATTGALSTNFSLTNNPGAASTIAATAGSGQSAETTKAFATALSATVKDQFGNLVSGVTVTFTAPGSGASGTFAGGGATATAVTNASGVATSPIFTANTTVGGPYNVTATAPGIATPANFSLTNTTGAPGSIAATSGSGQSAQVGAAFAAPLTATVKDQNNNAVSGVTVTFTAPGSGASGTFAGGGVTATAVTNASGVATSPVFTANNTVGAYQVSASAPGVATPANFSLTNTAGAAASITATAGSGQSAQINTAFGTALSATVKDQFGNLVSGVTVTFTAPASGASGAFGGNATATAVTNASGVATAPVFTANGTTGSYQVVASAPGVATGANFALTNTVGAPSAIAVQSGSGQSAKVSTAFGSPLVAKVTDAGGNVVPGATVTFTIATASGATATFANGTNTTTAVTNAQGLATSSVLTANATVGSYTATAAVNGVATPATFNLQNTPGDPGQIAVNAGNNQSVDQGAAFAPLSVVVKDAGGNTLGAAITVTFTINANNGVGGTFAGGVNTATTNAQGIATAAVLTAGTKPGDFTVTASANGVGTPATFNLNVKTGAAASVTATSGTPQTTEVGTAFAAPLVATVKDSNGNPVPNVVVTFNVPGSGPSGSFAGGVNTATTNASGVATSAVFTANNIAGNTSYFVTATVAGVQGNANFALTNKAGAPDAVAVSSGSGQTTKILTAFGSPLVATVKDKFGNPISGQTVTFIAPGGGASATFAGGVNTAITDASGVATSGVVSANGTTGSYVVNATVPNLTPAAFNLTNTPGDAANIAKTGGDNQSAKINTAFAQPLSVKVTDAQNNPIGGAQVTFTVVPNNGAGGALAGSGIVTTDASGVATSTVLTANAKVGTYTVTAKIGALTATFSETNTVGDATNIAVSGGNNQQAGTNTAFANPLSVTVTDVGGNPVGGVTVTFNPPASGASGTFAGGNTAVTNTSGVATSGVFTANATGGAYTVSASIPGGASTNFSLTNTSVPASITATAGSGQSGAPSTAFGTALKATVKDANGAGLPGVTVTFTVVPNNGSGGSFGSGSTTTAVTDAAGVATAGTLTANSTNGSFTVVANISPALATPAVFNLTILQPPVIAPQGGSGQSAYVNTTFPAALQATVTKQGQPVAGASVTFTAPGSGATVLFSNGTNTITAVTNASGVANSGLFNANGVVGVYNVVATTTGAAAPALFGLTNVAIPVCSGFPPVVLQNVTVGKDLQSFLSFTLPTPAPEGGIQFVIASNDSTKLMFTTQISPGPDQPPVQVGVTSVVVGVKAGVQTGIVPIQGRNVGTAQAVAIVDPATGFCGGTSTVTVTPSGFVLSGANGVGGAVNLNQFDSGPLTISSARLDNNLNFVEVQALRPGITPTVALTSSNASIASPASASVTFQATSSSATTTVKANAAGQATITAETPAGFSTPTGNANKVSVTVQQASLITHDVLVGNGLQASTQVDLVGAAPPPGTPCPEDGSICIGLTVTVTSSDPSRVKFSRFPGQEGSASIDLPIPVGLNHTDQFFVQGFASSGSVQYTAVAPGFGSATSTVGLSPGGIILIGPGTTANPLLRGFSLATNSPNATIGVIAARLDSGGNYLGNQSVRGGLTATVTLGNTNPSAGTFVNGDPNGDPNQVSIPGGTSIATAIFDPIATGATEISVTTANGLDSPNAQYKTMGITVVQPTVTPTAASVGKNLQTLGTVTVPQEVTSPLVVTVTTVDPNLRLSSSATTAGSSSAFVTIPAGSRAANFYIQSLTDSGSATYTASAPNYLTRSATVTFTPSGVEVGGPFGPGQIFPFTAPISGGPKLVQVLVVPLDPVTLAPDQSLQQTLAGGMSVTVSLSSNNTTVGTVTPQLTINGGSNTADGQFTPKAVGQATISITPPANFTTLPLSLTTTKFSVPN